jgi:uncharacterized protein involved in cysteine biosynthesis
MKNLGQAGSFLFDDKDWIQKLLVGVAFMFLSIVFVGLPFLFGYLLQLARRSADGEQFPLPDWNDLPALLGRGLMFLLIYLIYAVPLGIVAFLLFLIPGVGWLLAATLPPLTLLFVMPYLTVNFARHGDLNVAFDIPGLLEFCKTHLNNLIIATLVSYVFFLISLFGVLALVVGLLFTFYWALLAAFFLFGRIYYEAESSGLQIASARHAAAPPATELPSTPEAATDSASRGGEESSDQGVDEGPDRISS